jgi:group I intron endonuclease
MIRNARNGRKYIGSTNRATERKREHFSHLRRNAHHCDYLQRAWNKENDESVFEFIMFIFCLEEDLIALEQSCFDTIKPEYNSSRIAGRPEMTETTRMKISVKLSAHASKPESKQASRERMLAVGDDHWQKSEAQRQRMRDTNPMFDPAVVEKAQNSRIVWISENKEQFDETRRIAGQTTKQRNKEDPSRLQRYTDALLAYAATELGKADYKQRGLKSSETQRKLLLTEDGAARYRQQGQKSGATRKARGSQKGQNHWTFERGHSDATKQKLREKFSGERSSTAKLKIADVIQIRESDLPVKNLAQHYGVTEQNIRDIRKGKTWKSVPFMKTEGTE